MPRLIDPGPICEKCGFTSSDEGLFEERDGMLLCPECYEKFTKGELDLEAVADAETE